MDKKFGGKYRTGTARLAHWDYATEGGYFVTICVKDKRCVFGEVKDGHVVLNDCGRIVQDCWLAVPEHFPHTSLGPYVVMPNHVHGIIFIHDRVRRLDDGSVSNDAMMCRDAKFCVSTANGSALDGNRFGPQSMNLGSIVRGFKAGVTTSARDRGIPFVWLERYHDHVIRHDQDLARISKYIEDNPLQWSLDEENPG